MKSTFLLALSLLISTQILHGDLVINELMASNTRSTPDITDFEDYPDWIELHNRGNTPISLAHHFLSDDPENILKWGFASDAVIQPGEYLVVFADGNDSPQGQTHRRDYWPFHPFVAEHHHTNFSLSSSGESVILSRSTPRDSQLITPGSVWKYLDDGSDQGEAWRASAFDDSAWSSGPAPLGYNDDEVTQIQYGLDWDRHVTSYFRHQFLVGDTSALPRELLLRAQIDDGAIFYLNGTEVGRFNLASEGVDFDTTAQVPMTQNLEEIWREFQVPSSAFVEGVNVLAVEVHQINRTSVDMRLDVELSATVYENPVQLDSVTYGQQVTDVSLGRDPSRPEVWVQFATSTAGGANAGSQVTNLREASDPVMISPRGGIFTQNQTVQLLGQGSIHYTLDGREPSPSDPIYASPLQLNGSTVVRARIFEDGKVPGPISTATYLIREDLSSEVPVLSIVADPATLFDDQIGIYYNQHEPVIRAGPAVYKGKDAPGHLEFFPEDGTEGFSVNGAFRIGGENNWADHFQRAFNFSLRGKYGDDEINYPIFPGSDVQTFTALTIREGGDDYAKARMTDAAFDRIAEGFLNVETNQSRATEVYVNGRYWGHYNMRDRWDDRWFFQKYGVDDGQYDRVVFHSHNDNTVTVESGSDVEWYEFYEFIETSNLSDPLVWGKIESQMDVDSFIDFVVAESWGGNTSWAGNREVWKPHRRGGKWRWMIPDMDRTFGSTSPIFQQMANWEQMLKYLRNNQVFVARLAQRYSAHLETTLSEGRVIPIIDQMGSEIRPTIQRTFDRWGNTQNPQGYEEALESMREYVRGRDDEMRIQMRSIFGLADPVSVNLAVTGQGVIQVAGVEVSSSSLRLFPGLATTFTAVPAPGYGFVGWGNGSSESSIELTPQSGTTVSAVFAQTGTSPLAGTLGSSFSLLANTTYDVSGDLIVPAGMTLTIPEGVRLRMDPGVNIRVMGRLVVSGTSAAPVMISSRVGETWGGLSFENPDAVSVLEYLTVRDSTRGKDPLVYPSSISGLNATLEISNLDIRGERGPLFFRGGSLTLRDSLIDIPITGDGINVKQGAAITEGCTFTGNGSPDTDAIDYDGVVDGVIRNCRIYNFVGFNSDGIDTGEQCRNCLIEGNTIYFCSDKGISVGQSSEVIVRQNIIVGSSQGIGIKDTGSTATIDQNTIVNCVEGVSVFEKNFGSGGGIAAISNTIFSGCEKPVSQDGLSTLSVVYSLSDTVPLVGANNLVAHPQFVDAGRLDFELLSSSPAIDAGDPAHELDPDNTRADIGATYQFNPDDYPFLVGDIVVINEVLTHSSVGGDWIELHNRGTIPVDLSGWFLSDDGTDLGKYRIADGTTIGPGEFLVFTEEDHFGANSVDSGRVEAFALSATGETLHLTGANNYHFRQSYPSSEQGRTIGVHDPTGSGEFEFVRLASATPGAANSEPVVGPIIISEIMYAPAGDSAAEYIELTNISSSTVMLFDEAQGLPWKITDGIEFTFPTSPLSLAPQQQLILTRNEASFRSLFSPPANTVVLQWVSGKLSNGGEKVEISQPGLTDSAGVVTYIPIDQVGYDDEAPWDPLADGTGRSLQRIDPLVDGSAPGNWAAIAPTPGALNEVASSFAEWAAQNGVLDPNDDPDGDGYSNLFEYATDSDPRSPGVFSGLVLNFSGANSQVSFPASYAKADVAVVLESSVDLQSWTELPTQDVGGLMRSTNSLIAERYFRLRVEQRSGQ